MPETPPMPTRTPDATEDAAAALPYDAILLTSFGGPEGPDDVMPFLRNVVRGRNVPDDRLEEVAEHYFARNGVSPINAQNRDLQEALQAEMDGRGHDLPVLFGNRNWDPYLADALAEAVAGGHRHLLALVTSAYSSYSGCRQYREDLARARDEVTAATGTEVMIDKVRVWFNHPGFVAAMVDRVVAALDEVDDDTAPVAYVTHSIPRTMSRHSDYVAQHLEACRLVTDRVRQARPQWQGGWELVYCSRSGPPFIPWLEPDVNDHIDALADSASAVVVAPIGFMSDHMEVIHDLDVEAEETAREHGMGWARAGTVGTHPAFVAALADLLEERIADGPKEALGVMGPWHDACPVDCCRVPDRDLAPTVAGQTARPGR